MSQDEDSRCNSQVDEGREAEGGQLDEGAVEDVLMVPGCT